MTDRGLDELLGAYREAIIAPEPSAQFMPRLWEAIEARGAFRARFGRLTKVFITAAAAIWLVLLTGLAAHSPSSTAPSDYDILADSHPSDAIYLEPQK